ncbi:MAG: Phospholipase/lecithinase/hemolysin [Verrucomicrobiales bacterium]|nr:Phospholipase/lecithinase/hemolysin [Verrucomicrobiales bacterium]
MRASYFPPLVRFSTLLLFPAGAGILSAGDHVLVVGDSLTKEYRSEFVALYPDRPAAWSARNWIEILDERRHDVFDLGSWDFYSDPRLTGHEFNWAKPGGTAREFRNFLRQTPDAEAEVRASSGGDAAWAMYPSWRSTFTGYVPQSQRLVVFFGGNDLALCNSDPEANPEVNGSPVQVDYERMYAGTYGAASDPERMRTSIRSNVKSILQWFRDTRPGPNGTVIPARFTGPMILCAVPHVGCTPKLQAEAGTDPAKTAVITQMIETLNVELRDFAASKDVGFADVYAVTKRILDPAPFEIGGVTFQKAADPDCHPRYLFSGDGFHPNTAAQAKIAQVVADAFLTKYPNESGDLQRVSDREIVSGVLGLPKDTGYSEWLTAEAVPSGQRGPLGDPDGDGVANVMEYALDGRSAATFESGELFTVVRQPHDSGVGEVLVVLWKPRFEENAYCDLVPQLSSGLSDWEDIPPEAVVKSGNGWRHLELQISGGGSRFFRLKAVVAP